MHIYIVCIKKFVSCNFGIYLRYKNIDIHVQIIDGRILSSMKSYEDYEVDLVKVRRDYLLFADIL